MGSDEYVTRDEHSLREGTVHAPGISILFPVAAIAVSEGLLYFGYTWDALGAHLLTLLFCVFAPLRFEEDLPLFRAFALVPVFRLVNLGMPVFFELTIFWFPLIYAPLIPAIYVLGYRQDDLLPAMGWKPMLLALPVALPASAALGVVEYLVIAPDSLVPAWNLWNLLLISVVMVCFVGFVEELLFRGVLQETLESHLGRWPGLLLASALFGLMHSGYGVPAEIAFAGGIGLLFGLVYDRTRSLALVSVMHGVLNVTLFAVVPLLGLDAVLSLAWLPV